MIRVLEKRNSHVLSNTGFRVKRGVCDEEVKAAKESLYTSLQHALMNSVANKKDINCSLLSFLLFYSQLLSQNNQVVQQNRSNDIYFSFGVDF
jgi:hypothetical protein